MTTFINRTPHDINAKDAEGQIVTFPREGMQARADETRVLVGVIGGINVYKTTYGDVYVNVYDLVNDPNQRTPIRREAMPDEVHGVMYIVSYLVASHPSMRHRSDIVSPGALMRDESGQPVGCDGFAIN